MSDQPPVLQPPWAPEAEAAVLGGMLVDGAAVTHALDVLTEADFYREANRRVFRTMTRLFDRGAVVDAITVAQELRAANELDGVGGQVYLAELLDAVPGAARIGHYADLIRDACLRRRLIDAGERLVRLGFDEADTPVEILTDIAGGMVFALAETANTRGPVMLKEMVSAALDEVERLANVQGGLTGADTGLPDLNRMTGGLQPSDMVILAARPSMGKTALATQIALETARRAPVLLFLLESSRQQLTMRALASEALVDLCQMTQGRMDDDSYVRLASVAGKLSQMPLWIDDDAVTLTQIRARSRRLKAERPDLALVVVDYIQLIQGPATENRQQEVSAISRGLKMLAKELELPVLALSQLSRANEQRADRRPHLSDLRDSGSLEQDADLVLFLYRPEYYMTATTAEEQGVRGKAELVVAKQRNGPTGTVDLYFRRESVRFESVTHREAPPDVPRADWH